MAAGEKSAAKKRIDSPGADRADWMQNPDPREVQSRAFTRAG
jgi:hypothetical protein